MVLKVLAVYDSKVEAYLSPFFMRSRGEALRGFESAVNDPQTSFCRYPADYTLFEIGEFDESTGRIAPHQAYVDLGNAVQFKRQPQEQVPLNLQSGAK